MLRSQESPARRSLRAAVAMAAVLTAAVALAGCEGGPTDSGFSRQDTGRGYRGDIVDVYGSGRDFHSVVIGDPFGTGNDAATQTVNAILTARNAYRDARMTDRPDETAELRFKLVFVFSPAKPVALERVCTDWETLETTSVASPIIVDAALCDGTLAVSFIRGTLTLPATEGAESPRFEQFINDLWYEMTPA